MFEQSVLINYFDNFYNKVIESAEKIDKVEIQNLHTKLKDYILNLEYEVNTRGNAFLQDSFKKVLYIMVSLADELFLNKKGGHIDFWEKNLLERVFFKSSTSGEEIFKKIDDFVESKHAMQIEIAICYSLALALGFKGKFKSKEHEILVYKKRLAAYINNFYNIKDADKIHISRIRNDSPVRYLPNPRRWNSIFFSILALIMIITSAIWVNFSIPINDKLNKVLKVVRLIH